MRQFEQQILPPGFPSTTVWSYGAVKAPGTVAQGGSFNYPAFTIEANWRQPVRVKWINGLVDKKRNYLPHLLPVDQTLHWANPGGGKGGRDTRPQFAQTPAAYMGPVPMSTHLHGAPGVGDESDGYPEAWFLPKAKNIPNGHVAEGSWYHTFAQQFQNERKVDHHSDEWRPGFSVSEYPNDDRASTMWYHDHTLGMTRLNVYAGPAGFYLLRGGPDDKVYDRRDGRAAVLPGPAPALGDKAGTAYYEIPIVIQDRSFNTDGSLFYPDTREFFDGAGAPYIPETDLSPIWNPEFFGNVMVVNGVAWPYQEVEARRYRLRLLNGCNSRFLLLQFADANVDVWQIGNEGGFLETPIPLRNHPADGIADGTGKVLLAPAERADVIVDFSNLPVGATVQMLNLGPDEPFGGFPTEGSDAATTGQVMEFRVIARRGEDKSTPPPFLQLPSIVHPLGGIVRSLSLNEEMSQFYDGPAAALLGTLEEGQGVTKLWMNDITENPTVGATEVWEIYNFTADAHPIHVHEVRFQVVDRQPLAVDEDGEAVQPAHVIGSPRAPEAWETGYKDTVIAYPGEVTRIRAEFDTPGLFVWHCHIVEHEDNEMMRPYAVGPIPMRLPDDDTKVRAAATSTESLSFEDEYNVEEDPANFELELDHDLYIPLLRNQ
ncbi:MAG: multicopper oxidase domain-containing protein [Caldilineaceae bacterium]|nr:multicopper oxidase domain-containing protein [Caldilineaceae bacterium]